MKYELEWNYLDDYKFNYTNWAAGYKNTAGSFFVSYDFMNNSTRKRLHTSLYDSCKK